MSGKSINFDEKRINESNFYKNKKLFKIDDIDVNKIVFPKKESYCTKKSFKYFIEYNDNDDIRPLCIKLPQIIGYVKCLIVLRQCLLRLVIKTVKKSMLKYGEKLSV